MAKGLITRAYLEDTADAIRVLRGESSTYTPDVFGEKILNAIPDVEVTDDIVSVTDAAAYPAEALEFAIEPVQDLHGYSKPWPAGGGKNLLLTTIENLKERNDGVNSWSGNEKTINGVKFTIQSDAQGNVLGILVNGTASKNTNFFIITASNTPLPSGTYIGSGCPSGGENGYKINFNINGTWAYGDTGNGVNLNGEVLGAAITITQNTTCNNLVFKPMIRLASDTDSTFEPYSNICPISGWTECNGERTGVNVWDEEWETGAIDNSTGENYALAERVRSKNYISVKPNTQYYLHLPNTYSSARVACYDKDKAYLGQSIGWLVINNNTAFTSPSNTYYIRFVVIKTDETYNHDISINYPATDTEYHAYTGTSIPITFPAEAGTVYGGKAKPILGKLVDGMAEVDLGDLIWTEDGSSETNHRIWATTILNKKNGVTNIISDTYKITSQITVDMPENSIRGVGSSVRIYVCDSDYDTASAFTTAVTGSKLVYELATPIEYDITPQQVQMLLGDNNIWCDTGDTTLEYKVDLGRYIAKLQASQAPQLSLSRQAVSLDAEPRDETTQSEVEGAEER